MKKNYLLTGLITSAVVLFASNALASDALQIFGFPTNTVVTYDNASGAYPVVTAILSRQGAVSGTHTFATTTLLAQDSTGSLDIFGINETTWGYSPQVGDGIYVQGTYSPYHQIPEVGTLQNFFQTSAGNPVSATLATISQLNVDTLPQSIAGYLIEVNNVTISGGGAYSSIFPTYAGGNVSYTITDGSGNMTLYDWVTSYSTCAAFGGTAVPTGPVDILGFDSVYNNAAPEFTPIEIISVPEPTALSLCALGGLALLLKFRRQK
jgi:hypothetical protein